MLMLKNRTLYFTLVGFSLLLLLSSCTHKYYAPSSPTLMGVNEKSELKLSGGFGTHLYDNSKKVNWQLMGAYSPVNRLKVAGSIFYLQSEEDNRYVFTNTTPIARGNGFIAEGALGTYWSKQKDALVTFDIYGGYGQGKVNNYYAEGGSAHLSFRKFFIQPGLHYEYEDIFALRTGMRFVNLDFVEGNTFGDVTQVNNDVLLDLQENDPNFLVEWSARAEVGLPYSKFFLGFTYTIPFRRGSRDYIIKSIFTTGATLELGGKKKKKK